jgi:hypothetical protein
LLIGNPNASWREWVKLNRGSRDFVCLDPSDPVQGVPGRLALFRGSRPVYSRFFGSLDAQRYPHVLLAALTEALARSVPDPIVQSFSYRPSPVLRHLQVLIAQLMQPEEILIAAGTEIDLNGFPTGPQTIDTEGAFPKMVQDAQRKAQWMKLLESCETHQINLRTVCVEGARLGAGRTLDKAERDRVGLEMAVHAEVCGSSLFIVSDEEMSESSVSRALDLTHTTRPAFARSTEYDNLYCSMARQSGEDFGLGFIQKIDWWEGTAKILSDAVPPAPVRILRIGSLRVDPKGREIGEAKPWQV